MVELTLISNGVCVLWRPVECRPEVDTGSLDVDTFTPFVSLGCCVTLTDEILSMDITVLLLGGISDSQLLPVYPIKYYRICSVITQGFNPSETMPKTQIFL